MVRKKGYNQFCPVAKGAEIFAERWTPLILRELLSGSHRFNDIRKGMPRISQSLLTLRLRELEDAELLRRRPAKSGRGSEYELTEAGEELRPVVEQLGEWGYRWAQKEITQEDLDAGLLMWDMQRRINVDRLPDSRVLVHFYFPDADKRYRRFWLLLEDGEVDLCLTNPGHEVDLTVESSLAAMTHIWLGDLTFAKALAAGQVELDGPASLKRSFPGWLGLSHFAVLRGQRNRPARRSAARKG